MDRKAVLARYQRLESDLAELIPATRFHKETNMKLERIAHLLELLGNPQDAFRSIHVGGTSGKGSTATMTAALLTRAGYRTGLYLSPHLQVLNECYQINNHFAATTDLADVFETLKPAIAQVARENPFGRPSYFEAQTALAFALFARKQVDVAVIEVGLGGALDATNVLRPQISVLTNVGLDHTEILGDTVELIAQNKARIIKPGQIVISGFTQPSTQAIVQERCATQGATLWQLGSTFSLQTESDDTFAVTFPDRTYDDLRVGLHGNFQMTNAAYAIAAVHAFTQGVAPSTVREGLQQAAIPGRLERVQEDPIVILDGAHNPDKIGAAAEAIDKSYGARRRVVVLSLKSDKAYRSILPHVLKDASVLVVTAFADTELWEACKPEVLAEAAAELAPGLEIRIAPDPMQALGQAFALAHPGDLIWVTGSLYLIGDIREYWFPSAGLLVQAEGATV